MPDLLTPLSGLLASVVSACIEEHCSCGPAALKEAMTAFCAAGPFRVPGLLGPAAARWCGSTPEAGLPAGVASVLLQAAVHSHSSLPQLRGGRSSFPAGPMSEADALLAGDALVPLAMEHLYTTGGVHSILLVQDAVHALCGDGVLDGLSLELDLAARGTAGSDAWRVRAGKLARFSSLAGARLAGASPRMLDDAARIGLGIGTAFEIIQSGNLAPDGRAGGRPAAEEAVVLLDEALRLVGDGPEGDLYRQVAGSVWWTDLFGEAGGV